VYVPDNLAWVRARMVGGGEAGMAAVVMGEVVGL
jgi:hypothetical protein